MRSAPGFVAGHTMSAYEFASSPLFRGRAPPARSLFEGLSRSLVPLAAGGFHLIRDYEDAPTQQAGDAFAV